MFMKYLWGKPMKNVHGWGKGTILLRRGAASLLVLTSLISPLASYAQVADQSQATPATDTSSQPVTNTDTPDASVPPLDSLLPSLAPQTQESAPPSSATPDSNSVPADKAPLPSDTSVSAQTAQPQSLTPSGAGLPVDLNQKAIDSKFYSEIDPVSGSLAYTFPIDIPPGRNGLQPNINLTYTSQPGSNANILGYGWDTSIPYIQRINKKGTDSLYAQNYFYSSLDGELYPTSATSTTYGAKIDNGNFNQYQFASSSSYWILNDKNGNTYTFGTTSAAQEASSSTQVYKWALQEERDTHGNYVTYQYANDKGELYPTKITYTNASTTLGIYEIDFATSTRLDIATSSAAGFPITSQYLISHIQLKVNGVLTKDYALSYSPGENFTRSLLSSVVESGYANGATTTLPAVTFNYTTGRKNWNSNPNYVPPFSFDSNTLIADVNGDSLQDFIQANPTAATSSVYLNSGTTWVASSTFALGTTTTVGRFIDVNGDHFLDQVTPTATYINPGTGFVASSTWALPTAVATDPQYDSGGVQFADVNGDGLIDILQADNTVASAVYLNNGAGWTLSSWAVPVAFVNANGDTYMRIQDVNGDGLPDLLQAYQLSSGGQNEVWINNGNGWTADPEWTVPALMATTYLGSNWYDTGVRFADINGDGLADIIQNWSATTLGTTTAWINTGSGWVSDPQWSPPIAFSTDNNPHDVRFADVNGDNMVDIISANTYTGDVSYINTGTIPDVLSKVTYAQGGTANYTYTPSEAYTSGGQQLNPKMPVSVNTVSSQSIDNGLGAVASTSYSYQGGEYYFAGSTNREFAGFQKLVKTDAAGNVTNTYYHQGNATSDTTHGEYQDNPSKIGKVYRTESYDNASNLYKKSIIKWDMASLSGGRTFVDPTQEVDSIYDASTTHKDVATTNTYDTTNGSLLSATNWGQVSGSDDGTFTDTGTDAFTASTTYATSSSPYFVVPSDKITTAQSGNKVNEQQFYYDSSSLGTVSIGNLTKLAQWISGTSTPTYASSTYAYNSLGLVTSQKDPLGNTTSYSYDSFNLYPASTTNALSKVTAKTYDYPSGQVATTTDPNGNIFATIYDGLGRPLLVYEPDPIAATSTPVLVTQYIYNNIYLPSIYKIQYLSSATSTQLYNYFDGLGRLAQTRSGGAQDYITTDYQYNNIGLLGKQSLPYFSNAASSTVPTTNAALYTTYSYDPVYRVKTLSNAVGSTTYAYNDWVTTVTDPDSHTKDLSYDAYGNLTGVTEHNGGNAYTTTYAYDGNKNLTSLTDASGNIRNFTYDALNDELSAQDLHMASDTSFGAWTYGYDAAGNRTSVVDPKSQTIQYTYDALNRPLTENYTGQAGVEKTYAYDSCSNGIGQLCSAATAAATTTYAYNQLGQPSSETEAITGGTSYNTQYGYDRQGNVIAQTYPDGSVVNYLYDNKNHLSSITELEAGTTTPKTIVADMEYGPDAQMTYQRNGNSVETFNTYDPNALYRLTYRKTVGPGTGHLFTPLAQMRLQQPLLTQTPQGPDFSLASPTNPIEVPNARTATSDTFLLGSDGKKGLSYVTQLHSQPIFMQDQSGAFVSITAPVTDSTANAITVTAAGYSAQVSKTASTNLFTFTNSSTPVQVSLADTKTIAHMPSYSSGVVTYSNELGAGTSIQLVPNSTGIQKNIVLTKTPSNPTGATSYSVTFKLSAAIPLDIQVDGKQLSAETTITSTNEAQIVSASGIVAYIFPPEATDSSNEMLPLHKISIPVTYTLKKDGIYITKQIPYSWLNQATYPVRADFTLSTNAGSGDGYVNAQPYPGSWATVHADTSGGSSTYVDNSMNVGSQAFYSAGGYLGISKVFVPFDTSSLPDNAVIGSTTLNVYVTTASDDFNDAYGNVAVYKGNEASPMALVASDVSKCGDAITNPTKGSSDIDITGISSGAYLSIPLNSTGLGWISTSTYTQLCLREGHDATNNEPVNNAGVWKTEGLILATSEAGTTTAPYLSIAYTRLDTAPATSTQLRAEDQTNPTNVTDTQPHFSAEYNDVDAGDTATNYELELATSSSGFGSPLWDSGELSLSPAVAAGYQSQNVPYTGSALALDHTTYYWRMKLWDAANTASPWSSGTDTFTMADDGTHIQSLHYTYDAVGNITGILDDVNGSEQNAYSYDPLNRLISASSTLTGGQTPYLKNYSYDSLGNLASSTDLGTYAYQGNTGTNYANPDAPTSIGNGTATSTLTYDNNGNLLSDGTLTNVWDYLNELTQVGKGGATSTYAYDYAGNRVKTTEGVVPTYYPNKFFSITLGSGGGTGFAPAGIPPPAGTGNGVTNKLTKNIYANGLLVATISTVGTTTAATSTLALNVTTTNISYGLTATTTTRTWTHKTSFGNNRLLVLTGDILQDVAGTGTISSVTYSGMSLTQATLKSGSNLSCEIWYLPSPPSGLNTISVAISGATDAIKLGLADFTGINTTTPIDATSTATGTTGNPTISTTTRNTNDLVIATLNRNSTSIATTSRTSLYRDNASSTLAAASYQVASVAGSNSDTYTGSVTQNWCMNMAAFVPAPTGTAVGTTSQIEYFHPDHLGGANAMTGSSGLLTESLQYYPYGALRTDTLVGNYSGEKRKFIGQQYDGSTALNYLNARYQDPARGQFLSQDPVFLSDPKNQILEDPQSLNSYSYAENNPITKKDPTGRQTAPLSLVSLYLLLAIAYLSLAISLSPQGHQAMQQATYGAVQAASSISIPAIHFGGSVSGIQSSPFSTPATQGIPSYSSNSTPSTNINFSKSGKATGTPKPNDAPSGTKPIDSVGLPRGTADQVKGQIDAHPNDWTGVTPNGDVITGTPDGKTVNHGPIDDYTHQPTGLVK